MTRLRFPQDRTVFVYQGTNAPILTPPRTGIVVYTDSACTTLANIQTLTGTTIADSLIFAEQGLMDEFLGPEGAQRLFVRISGAIGAGKPVAADSSGIFAVAPPWIAGSGTPQVEDGWIGSLYIDMVSHTLYGPKGSSGWPFGGFPLGGSSGGGAPSYIFNQVSPASTWTIDHTLAYRPAVTIVDSAGYEQHGNVQYPPANPTRIIVNFSAPFAGSALLS